MSGADLRALVHVAAGAMCILLAWLPPAAAVGIAAAFVAFNLWILPRAAGGRLRRADASWGPSDRGLVLYPASVLALLLALPQRPALVACGWALLAFGDGAASLVGRHAGGPKLPWNRSKSLAGFAAFTVSGGAAVSTLLFLSSSGVLPFRDAGLLDPALPGCWWFGVALCAALLAAAVESLPGGLDDNLTVPWAGAALLAGLTSVTPDRLATGMRLLVQRYPSALAVTLTAGILAYLLGQVSLSGLLGGLFIGTLIIAGLGWWAFGSFALFFILGSAATRVGLAAKQARGIAEAGAGARGGVHALAKGAVPALCALFALAGADSSACALAFSGAIGAAAFDTVASEIGKWRGGPTFLPGRSVLRGRLERVAPGTPGGISALGTAAGALAAALVAGLSAAGGLAPAGLRGALAVWVGSAAGSFAERPLSLAAGGGRAHPSALNLFNTLIGAAVALWLGLA
jgi:uncharacterized protein (TIGR00297 family)